jgi:CheY-like chemotaxis protein
VLIVDDDEGVVRMMTHLLQRLEVDSLVAHSGQAALTLCRERASAIDLVLLDVTMPHLSGEETLRRLRAEGSSHKVILMSGYSSGDAERRCAGLGTSGFLQKPFTLAELSALAAKHLS